MHRSSQPLYSHYYHLAPMSKSALAKLRPSSADKWMQCAGFIKLLLASPTQVSTPEQDEGNTAHKVAHIWFDRLKEPDCDWPSGVVFTRPDYLLGKALPPYKHIITTKMLNDVQVYVDYVFTLQNKEPDNIIFIEQSIDLSFIDLPHKGTVDAAIYFKKTKALYIIEFKFGKATVSVEDNEQLAFYSLGMIRHIEHKFSDSENEAPAIPAIKKLVHVVIQPNDFHSGETIKECAIDKPHKWFVTTRYRMHTRVLDFKKGDERFKTGEHCKHCDYVGNCSTLHKDVFGVFSTLERAENNVVDPESLGFYLKLLKHYQPLVTKIYDALKEQAKAQLKNGQQVPGQRLETAQGNRQWDKSDEEVIMIGQLCGVDLMEQKLASPAQAEAKGLSKTETAKHVKRKSYSKLIAEDPTDFSKRLFRNG